MDNDIGEVTKTCENSDALYRYILLVDPVQNMVLRDLLF